MLFNLYDVAAQATHEAVFGEPFLLRPTKRTSDVNAPLVPDVSRPSITLTGIYRETDKSMNVVDAWDSRADRRPGVSMHVHLIEIDPRRQAVQLEVGDVLQRVGDGTQWRVTSIDSDSAGRQFLNVERTS